jgi:hypothetical protein
MKKLIIVIINLISVTFILSSMNALQAIVNFVIAGQIPGTEMALDGQTMLALFLVPTGFILGRVFIRGYALIVELSSTKQHI